jgi:hypothetical protein
MCTLVRAASMLALLVFLTFGVLPGKVQGELLFDRGLPVYNEAQPNLNNAAGENRSNWLSVWNSGSTEPTSCKIYGDDFAIPEPGQYLIETVRVWRLYAIEGENPITLPDNKLWGCRVGDTPEVWSNTYTAPRVYYSNNEAYQDTAGTWWRIWQVDFTVNQVVEGDTTYQFFLDGLFYSPLFQNYRTPALHLSKAALSNAPQDGADDYFLSLNLTKVGDTWVPGTISSHYGFYDFTNGADGNVQVYGRVVPLPSSLVLSGFGLLGLAGWRGFRGKRS